MFFKTNNFIFLCILVLITLISWYLGRATVAEGFASSGVFNSSTGNSINMKQITETQYYITETIDAVSTSYAYNTKKNSVPASEIQTVLSPMNRISVNSYIVDSVNSYAVLTTTDGNQYVLSEKLGKEPNAIYKLTEISTYPEITVSNGFESGSTGKTGKLIEKDNGEYEITIDLNGVKGLKFTTNIHESVPSSEIDGKPQNVKTYAKTANDGFQVINCDGQLYFKISLQNKWYLSILSSAPNNLPFSLPKPELNPPEPKKSVASMKCAGFSK